MARPTKYDPARVKIVCQCLQDGGTRKAACDFAGVDVASLARWLARYADFAVAIARAEADAENLMVAAVRKSALGGDWRAAESWLKRRRREDWGDNEKVTHGGSLEFIAAAAATADAKFAAAVARSREPAAENLMVGAGTVNGPGGQGARG